MEHKRDCPQLRGWKKIDESEYGTYEEWECQDCGKKVIVEVPVEDGGE